MLAIVIPYYKITYFETTLNTLANQTDKRFNVYIGDDASPENPSKLLEKYKGQFDFSYHRFDENLGGQSLTKQWERCIDLTKDEAWIMILGDDDYLEETVIESWYKNYDVFVSKSNLVRFATKMINEKDETVSDVFMHPVWEQATDAYLRKFNYLTRSSLSEYIFKRKVYLKYGFYNYPLAWNSDDHAWLEFSDDKPIYTINKSLIYFRLSSSNISGKEDNVFIKSVSQNKFYKFLINKKLWFYNKEDRIRILRRYENHIFKIRKPTLGEWLYLMFRHMQEFNPIEIKKVIKRFLNTILRRHEY